MSNALDSGPYSRVYAAGMTDILHLPARAGAPIACDMSTARDTPEQRLAEYRELFERALLGRERRADGVVLRFRDRPGIREHVDDLAHREHACCPFLDYHVETAGDEVIWTITNPVTGDERDSADAILDAFHALPTMRFDAEALRAADAL
jgi:hypothetical protein